MDDFAALHPGRRLTFTYPRLPSLYSSPHTPSAHANDFREDNRVATDVAISKSATYVVTVLDVPAGRPSPSSLCAAMIAPDKEIGSPGQWIYTSVGGQWELLASADVARLIVIQRGSSPQSEDYNSESKYPPSDQDPVAICPGPEKSNPTTEEELQSLIWSLASAACFETKNPIPFLKYVTDVRQRVVVAQAESALTGLMVVEDVEVGVGDSDDEEGRESDGPRDTRTINESDSFCTRLNDSHPFCLTSVKGENSTRHDLPPGSPLVKQVVYRRRLRFESMPNLIQSEVPLLFNQPVRAGASTPSPHKRRKLDPSSVSGSSVRRGAETVGKNIGKSNGRSFGRNAGKSVGRCLDSCAVSGALGLADVARGPDLSHLVHKYLPPIVAGLALIGRSLEGEWERGRRPKVVVLGGGAFTLPLYLRNQFPFTVEAVEVDRVVVRLAKKYFGLLEDSNMTVRVGDAHGFVVGRAKEIACIKGAEHRATEGKALKNGAENGEMNEFGENSKNGGIGGIGGNGGNGANGGKGGNGGNGGNGGIHNFEPEISRRGKQGMIGVELSANVCVDRCGFDKPQTILAKGGGKQSPSLSFSSECETDSESNGRSSPTSVSRSGSESEGECGREAGKNVDDVGRGGVCTDTCFTNDVEDLQYFCVVLDVGVNDGKLGLSSPPSQFLSINFLSKVKKILRRDGIFAINVVPLSENAYTDACRNLKEVFLELWEIRVDGDANRILFALPEVSGDRKALSLAGAKFAQSDWFLESIRKL